MSRSIPNQRCPTLKFPTEVEPEFTLADTVITAAFAVHHLFMAARARNRRTQREQEYGNKDGTKHRDAENVTHGQ
jgi:hypothetical protein